MRCIGLFIAFVLFCILTTASLPVPRPVSAQEAKSRAWVTVELLDDETSLMWWRAGKELYLFGGNGRVSHMSGGKAELVTLKDGSEFRARGAPHRISDTLVVISDIEGKPDNAYTLRGALATLLTDDAGQPLGDDVSEFLAPSHAYFRVRQRDEETGDEHVGLYKLKNGQAVPLPGVPGELGYYSAVVDGACVVDVGFEGARPLFVYRDDKPVALTGADGKPFLTEGAFATGLGPYLLIQFGLSGRELYQLSGTTLKPVKFSELATPHDIIGYGTTMLVLASSAGATGFRIYVLKDGQATLLDSKKDVDLDYELLWFDCGTFGVLAFDSGGPVWRVQDNGAHEITFEGGQRDAYCRAVVKGAGEWLMRYQSGNDWQLGVLGDDNQVRPTTSPAGGKFESEYWNITEGGGGCWLLETGRKAGPRLSYLPSKQ